MDTGQERSSQRGDTEREREHPDGIPEEAKTLFGLTDAEYREAEGFLSSIGSAILKRHKQELEGEAPQDDTPEKILLASAGAIHALTLMAEDGVFSDEINQKFKENPIQAAQQLYKDLMQIGKTAEQDPAQISLFPDDERPIDVLPRLLSIIPDKHLIPNNKLANTLTKGIVDAGGVELRVSPQRRKPVYTICNLVYEGDNVKLTGRQTVTEYDRNVYNAAVSLFVYGDQSHIVTPAMVYRAMTGMSDTQDPSPQQIGAVTKSLDKMRFIKVTIDCTEEFRQHHIPFRGKEIIFEDYLLNAKAVKVDTGSQVVKAYKINEPPILYTYSNRVKQVITIPATLLDIKAIDSATGQITGERVSNTEGRIQLKGYLLRRIEGMKGKNALKNNSIPLYSYEKDGEHKPGLYEMAGTPEPNTKDATRIRGYIAQVLEYWIAEGYIKGYQWTKTGRQITGVEITP